MGQGLAEPQRSQTVISKRRISCLINLKCFQNELRYLQQSQLKLYCKRTIRLRRTWQRLIVYNLDNPYGINTDKLTDPPSRQSIISWSKVLWLKMLISKNTVCGSSVDSFLPNPPSCSQDSPSINWRVVVSRRTSWHCLSKPPWRPVNISGGTTAFAFSLIGHFRVHLRLHFKSRLSAKYLL